MNKYLLFFGATTVVLLFGCGKNNTPASQSQQTQNNQTLTGTDKQSDQNTKNDKKNGKSTKKVGKMINIGPGLEKDNNNIYHNGTVIEDADVKSFSIVFSGDKEVYAKDKNNVYLIKKEFIYKIYGCDPNTVQIVNNGYIKDKNSIYGQNQFGISEIKNIDYKTFQAINNKYAKDKNNVYSSTNIVNGADPKSFQILWSENMYSYAKDNKNIFFGYGDYCSIIYGVDYKTFQAINNKYAKDKNNVYLLGTILEGANPATFQVINEIYTKDNKNVYRIDKIIKGANPATFQIIKGEYTKDNKNVYLLGNIVKGADPKSFTP